VNKKLLYAFAIWGYLLSVGIGVWIFVNKVWGDQGRATVIFFAIIFTTGIWVALTENEGPEKTKD